MQILYDDAFSAVLFRSLSLWFFMHLFVRIRLSTRNHRQFTENLQKKRMFQVFNLVFDTSKTPEVRFEEIRKLVPEEIQSKEDFEKKVNNCWYSMIFIKSVIVKIIFKKTEGIIKI